MNAPDGYLGFKPLPGGWTQQGDRWAGREIASVHPPAHDVRVVLSCRKLWQIKEVRAASIAQGKRYAERWCAARVLPELPLREAVARLVKKDEPPPPQPPPSRPRFTRTERRQQRRLNAIPNPRL